MNAPDNTATLTSRTSKFDIRHRRENGGFYHARLVVDLDQETYASGRGHAAVELRLYNNTTGSKTSACLWVRGNDFCTSGSASVGGYGYHRGSGAADAAIKAAGIDLARRIDGVGDGAIDDALLAIAKAVGIKRPALISTHA